MYHLSPAPNAIHEPFLLEVKWKRRGEKKKKTIYIQREDYKLTRVGRSIRMKLKIVPKDSIVFNIKRLKIYILNKGTHFIYIAWRLQSIKYKLHINRIDFMSRLLDLFVTLNVVSNHNMIFSL